MIVKQSMVLHAGNRRIEVDLKVDAGVNFRNQHEALQWLNALTNKLGLLLNEDPTKWQPRSVYLSTAQEE